MNSLIAWGVVAAVCIAAILIANWRAKQAGAALQAEADAKAAKEAEDAIHQVQAETRDTADTVVRLNKGNF